MIAGVDEAGRGAWIGNVVAAAVILPNDYDLPDLTDSKKLSAAKRERLCAAIYEQAIAVACAWCSPEEIDQLNIHYATLCAMKKAVIALKVAPTEILIDGKFAPELPFPTRTIIGGDALEPAISAASIVAKVTRDKQMIALDALYPDYGFAAHKGYGTQKHQQALRQFGVLPLHRRSYAPIAALLKNNKK